MADAHGGGSEKGGHRTDSHGGIQGRRLGETGVKSGLICSSSRASVSSPERESCRSARRGLSYGAPWVDVH